MYRPYRIHFSLLLISNLRLYQFDLEPIRTMVDICGRTGLGASVPGKRRCEQHRFGEEIRRSTLEVLMSF